MPDKPLLDVPPSIEIQVQIDGGGLDTFMSQMILDIRDGMAAVKHVNCPGVAETVNGMDIFQPFGRKGLFEILPAYAVDAMTGKLLSPLVDKEPILVHRFWRYAILFDIDLEEMASLGFELYDPETISFAEDP